MKTSDYRGGLASDDHATHIRAAKEIASAIYYVLINSFAKVLRTTSAKNSCSSSINTFPLTSIYAKYATAALKVSYSCMPNMDTIISSHNKNLLNKKQKPKTIILPRNYRKSANRPINGECLEKAVI